MDLTVFCSKNHIKLDSAIHFWARSIFDPFLRFPKGLAKAIKEEPKPESRTNPDALPDSLKNLGLSWDV